MEIHGSQAFVMEKDSKRFPKSGGWGYAVFNYEAASGKFTADPAPSDCGKVCHVKVKAIGMGHRQRATKPSHSGYYTRSDKLQPSFLMNGGYERLSISI